MPDNEELSSLEQVRRRLYDPQHAPTFEEPHLQMRPVEKARGWEHLKAVSKEAEHISGPARFFIVAVLFFVLTAGGAVFYLVWGGRAVSTNNVIITVQGPTTISSGDTVPLLVTIENRNPVAMRGASITIDFPDGTKSPDDPNVPLSTYNEDIGDIDAGAKVERTVRASVFGSEGQGIILPMKIEYHTDSSNAVFVKNKQYDFTVTTSPITLNVNALSQVSSGQSVTVDVDVKSNASTPLQNVAVSAQYPFGFVPSATNPQPTNGTLFVLGTLAPGEDRHITITGVVTGDNNDDRVFSFNAGTLTSSTTQSLATSYTSKQADIKVTKPFLSTTLSVNHDTSDTPVVDAGAPAQVILTWANTLPTAIQNARITVTLGGDALDPSHVSSGTGFYNSSNNTIVFDSTTNPALAALQPGDTGQGTFNFTPKASSAGLRNPAVSIQVSVAGSRLSESNVPETITSTLSRTVKVGTNLALATHIVYSTGPFKNTGPWPPSANLQTTYTVIYSLTNAGNSVAGTKVSAALPPYVTFSGATSPNDGSITYNDTTRTVTWNAGDVAAGGTAKTAAFQIVLTPSVTQQNSSPILINAQQVTAVDRFTQRNISGSMPALNTQITQDPGYSAADGTVK